MRAIISSCSFSFSILRTAEIPPLLKTVLKYGFAKRLLIPLNPDHVHQLAFMCFPKVSHHIIRYNSIPHLYRQTKRNIPTKNLPQEKVSHNRSFIKESLIK